MDDRDLLEHLRRHPGDRAAGALARTALAEGRPAFLRAVERTFGAAAAAPPPDPAPPGEARWTNQAVTVVNRPRELYQPRTLLQVRCAVADAERRGLRVRAVATGHSYADITAGHDVLLDMSRFSPAGQHGLLPLEDHLWRAPGEGPPRVRVAAGARIHQLTETLRQSGLAFPNLGGFNGQTLVGAICTSTHGSGAALPPLPDSVRSLDLVAAGGQAYRVEPGDGPTDPVRFAERYAPAELTLIQDDDTFWSAVVNLGCMGVVTSMVVEVGPAFRLRQRRSAASWAWVRAQLEDPEERLLRSHRHVEVWINPFPANDGDHRCLVTRRDLAPPDDHRARDGARWGRDRRMNLPPTRLSSEWAVSRPALHRAITAFVDACPGVVDSMIDASLDVVSEPPYLVQDSDAMFSIGAPNDTPTLSTEIAFPIERAAAAVEALFEVAARLRREGRALQTAPFSLRFVAESRASLSMMHGRGLTCTVELPVLKLSRGAALLMLEYERVAYGHEGRPHWGQLHWLTHCHDFLSLSYGAGAEAWKRAYRRFNPRGTFDNHFTDRMGLSQGARS